MRGQSFKSPDWKKKMDTINAKILEIRNDHENVFHLKLAVEIPNAVALIRIAPTALREDLLIDFRSRQPTDPRYLIGTTIGDPAMKVGDIVAIQVFYDNEVVLKNGRTVPISECY
jgi:hypothetical protein